MAIDTYAKLQSAISDELNRNDLLADVTAYSSGPIDGSIKRAIATTELRLNRTVRIRQMETSTTITLVANTSAYSLPSDFLQARVVYLSVDPIQLIEQTTLENLFAQYPQSTTQRPEKMAIVGSTFQVRPIPDAAYTVPFYYYATPAPLSDTNSTNTLFATCPDLYLYGSCLELARFLGEDERLQVWKGFYDEGIRLLTEDSNSAKWSGVLVQSALPVTMVV
jgi:hypothetical protein